MPDLIVVEQLRDYLITEGVANGDMDTPSLTLPSIWLMPRDGAPLPREGETMTLTLHDTNLNGPPGVEAWLEDTFIDIIIRAKNAGEAKLLHRSIKSLLHPIGVRPSGKQHWTMNELPVLYSATWRGEQPLPRSEDGKTYDRIASFRFRCARSDLAA